MFEKMDRAIESKMAAGLISERGGVEGDGCGAEVLFCMLDEEGWSCSCIDLRPSSSGFPLL